LPNASICPKSGNAPGILGGALPGETFFSVFVLFITQSGQLRLKTGDFTRDAGLMYKTFAKYPLSA
jgi:hypothetical protein